MATLNRAGAEAMIDGPAAGLRLMEQIEQHPAMARSHHMLASVPTFSNALASENTHERTTWKQLGGRSISPSKNTSGGAPATLDGSRFNRTK